MSEPKQVLFLRGTLKLEKVTTTVFRLLVRRTRKCLRGLGFEATKGQFNVETVQCHAAKSPFWNRELNLLRGSPGPVRLAQPLAREPTRGTL